jgi:hypothetical protein
MSEINPREVFFRLVTSTNRLSIQRAGIWGFENYTNYQLSNIIDGVYFYKIPFNFGVCQSNQFDPSIMVKRGVPGDYLVVDQNNNLSILTEEQFKKQNPNLAPK